MIKWDERCEMRCEMVRWDQIRDDQMRNEIKWNMKWWNITIKISNFIKPGTLEKTKECFDAKS